MEDTRNMIKVHLSGKVARIKDSLADVVINEYDEPVVIIIDENTPSWFEEGTFFKCFIEEEEFECNFEDNDEMIAHGMQEVVFDKEKIEELNQKEEWMNFKI